MLENLEQIHEKMRRNGIICARPVSKPLHADCTTIQCPRSDKAYNNALSIPLYPSLSQGEIDYVVAGLQEALRSQI
jgi:dTDP-4-amino-4,6-dideoxygalactose transaminase